MRILHLRVTTLCLLICLSWLFLSGGENPDPERFREEIDTFLRWDSKNASPARPVLFVGSSSIRLWRTHDLFPELPVINRGFGGSHISDVNYFIDILVLKFKPALIVFYCGDNDIADGKGPATVFSDFVKFTQAVHEKLPETGIIYLPIKPSPVRWHVWPAMRDANNRVKEFCANESYLYYVDTTTPMLGENERPVSALFVSDSLHLSQTGYKLWTDLLTHALQVLLKK